MNHRKSNEYQAESSESEIESDEDQSKVKLGGEFYDDSSDEEEEHENRENLEDSLDSSQHKSEKNEEEEDSEEYDSSEDETNFQNARNKNEINTIREDPGEASEDESIDYIEQRIKKLERDLEDRLNKHQKPQIQEPKKQQGKIVTKATALPPMPQKKNQGSENKMNTMNAINKTEITEEKNIEHKVIETPPPITNANIQKPKKSIIKEPNPELKVENKLETKASVELKKPKVKKEIGSKEDEKMKQILAEQGEKNNKISELERIVKELRIQNQVLKQKFEAEKAKNEKPKNKTVEQLEKVKLSISTNDKLEKEIELLDVIEKLQAKLKKSINRKLSAEGNGASSLLHKGLPSSLQSNY